MVISHVPSVQGVSKCVKAHFVCTIAGTGRQAWVRVPYCALCPLSLTERVSGYEPDDLGSIPRVGTSIVVTTQMPVTAIVLIAYARLAIGRLPV